jgi:hypothetical protein
MEDLYFEYISLVESILYDTNQSEYPREIRNYIERARNNARKHIANGNMDAAKKIEDYVEGRIPELMKDHENRWNRRKETALTAGKYAKENILPGLVHKAIKKVPGGGIGLKAYNLAKKLNKWTS